MTTTKKLSELAKGVKMTAERAPHDYAREDDWQQRAHKWACTLQYQGRRVSLPFWKGESHSARPTAMEVLGCVLSDASSGEADSFAEFCAELGYDDDSRKAEKIYAACQQITKKLRQLLRDDFDAFILAGR